MTTIEVPDELAPQFADALTRPCFVCGHRVEQHLRASACACCAKGTKMPSEVANRAIETVKQAAAAAREIRRARGGKP
ncbi:MAG TPA: hypothetical protein VGG32_02545 [Thermoplasmata archaeon]|jgi:hypothetical protein